MDDELVLEDGNGAHAIIKFCGPDEPNKGLGFRICPSGKQKHQFEAIREKVQEVCGAIQSAHLTEKEARQALFQRIVLKLFYPLHLVNLTKRECQTIDGLICNAISPQMRLNRNFPSAVAYGPAEYGGLEFPDTYTLQTPDPLPISVVLMGEGGCQRPLSNIG